MDRNYVARESEVFYRVVRTLVAIAICFVLAMGAASALAPESYDVPAAVTYADSRAGFPPHVFDRVRELEVMPDLFE